MLVRVCIVLFVVMLMLCEVSSWLLIMLCLVCSVMLLLLNCCRVVGRLVFVLLVGGVMKFELVVVVCICIVLCLVCICIELLLKLVMFWLNRLLWVNYVVVLFRLFLVCYS